MPNIRFTALDFPEGVLPDPLPTEYAVNRLELVNEAVRVGTASHLGGYHRPFLERLWRATMVWAFLEERDRAGAPSWASSQAFTELDPSEKGAVSFHLGLLQASTLTKRLLGLSDVVHVDAVLGLLGIPLVGRRPDLVGYDPAHRKRASHGRVLIESKGRSTAAQSDVNDALRSAREQLQEFHGHNWNYGYALVGPSPLLIASVGHFTRSGYWQGALQDPPTARRDLPPEVQDDEFQGLLNLASLQPIVAAIAEIRRYAPERVTRDRDQMTFARLPGIDLVIGLPTEVYDNVERIAGSDNSPRTVTLGQAAAWAQELPDRRQRADVYRDHVGREHQDEFARFHLDDDGVVVGQLREGNGEDDEIEEFLPADPRA